VTSAHEQRVTWIAMLLEWCEHQKITSRTINAVGRIETRAITMTTLAKPARRALAQDVFTYLHDPKAAAELVADCKRKLDEQIRKGSKD
jgi:hypothetical protein